MIPKLILDLGRLYPNSLSKFKYRYGIFECPYCYTQFKCITTSITNGYTKSCGCLVAKKTKELNSTHGKSKNPIFKVWMGMIKRCTDPKIDKYACYGGRGIEVCDRWLDVNNFIEDMYPSFENGLSLDRIDVNGNYEPDNCRWTTKEVQARNTRDIMRTNTSGYRGVSWIKKLNKWRVQITVSKIKYNLGVFTDIVEAAKAYERYVRLNNLEHNFTPVLTEKELEDLKKENNV